ncbi:MAG: CHASE domain-containing protein [Gemmatimonadota bacterium]|nr:CHASE domain-containing protein [Gemmatimonadota bacterium]
MIHRSWTPWLILAASLLLTAAAAAFVHLNAEARDQARFENAVRATEDRVAARLDAYVALLRGGSGLFAASGEVTRSEFREYVARLGVEEQYPGVQGIGFSLRIPAAERDSLVAAVRAERPDFAIQPANPRPEIHSILYLEPLDRRNAAAIGFDMFTEPVRRAAMLRAAESGAPALSGSVTLVQEIDERRQAGFLIYVPVYRGGAVPTTAAERRARLQGFVYSPFRADDLFAGLFGTERRPRVSLRVYDGSRPEETALLHDSEATLRRRTGPRFTSTTQREVAGHTWTLAFASLPAFEQASGHTFVPSIVALGTLISLVLFGLALSERHARRQAEQANRTKGGFLATMSHELRTPLNAMIGYTELLRMGIPDPIPPRAKEQVERIDRAARHLLSLIEEILTFSRLDAGRETVRVEPVDLPDLVHEVVAIIQPLANTKGLHFHAPEPPAAPLRTDPRKLRQILINLLGNAVKFTDRGEIRFEVEAEEGGVAFRVQDTGIGIAPEDLERIWEPFRQVDNAKTRSVGGTGLGLSVSRQLARLLSGKITVESTPEEGSTFTLWLPARA